eukprot:GEMP01084246.1.p1 GENE.GEMP01084246.1~~GEMP01084246.1.p1  ORF type:complete len:225 (+),score=23.34 GEMP01084246.1:76-675(+)
MTTSDDIDWTNTSNWNKDMGMTSQEGAVWEVTEDVLLRVEVAMSSTVIRLVPRGETLRQIGNVYAIEDPHCQGLLRAEVECVEGLQESGWVTVCAWAIGGPRYLKHVQEPLKTLATKPVRASSNIDMPRSKMVLLLRHIQTRVRIMINGGEANECTRENLLEMRSLFFNFYTVLQRFFTLYTTHYTYSSNSSSSSSMSE